MAICIENDSFNCWHGPMLRFTIIFFSQYTPYETGEERSERNTHKYGLKMHHLWGAQCIHFSPNIRKQFKCTSTLITLHKSALEKAPNNISCNHCTNWGVCRKRECVNSQIYRVNPVIGDNIIREATAHRAPNLNHQFTHSANNSTIRNRKKSISPG